MTTSYTDVENAIVRWVQPASGLTARHVVWDYWKAPRPAVPFVELSISEDSGIGEAWLITGPAPDPQPGAEIQVLAQSHREIRLTIQVFGDLDSGNTAWPIMSRIASSIDLYVYQLDLAGVGVGDVGPVQMAEGKRGGTLEPRARCQFTLHIGAEVESRLSFFERMELTFNVEEPTVSTTIEVDLPHP